MVCEQSLNVQSKAITYLLGKYGVDVNAMISHKLNIGEDSEAILIEGEESPPPILTKSRNEMGPEEAKLRNRSRSAEKSPTHLDDSVNKDLERSTKK